MTPCLLGLLPSLSPISAPASMEADFARPSDEYALQAWYHWVGSFVTEKGITADLEAMKDFGIAEAHVFGPGHGSGLLPGNAVAGTDAWFGMADFAAREAVRLGLSLGAHNCPGWTSSGGRWIRPEDAMKDVVSSYVDVTGGITSVCLPRPTTHLGFYRDIAVFSFPWTAPPKLVAVQGDMNAFSSRTFEYVRPWTPKSLVLDFRGMFLIGKLTIEASSDGREWKSLLEKNIRYCHVPEGVPCISDIPSERAFRFFRVSIASGERERPVQLADLRFEAVRMFPDVHAANGSQGTLPNIRCWEDASAAGIDKGAVVDLSGRMGADGLLNWSVPAGTWRIVRLGYTAIDARCNPADPKAAGLECDKLSRRGLDAHWPHMPARYLSTSSGRKAFKTLSIDSYELPGQSWTQDFSEQFARRRGYSLGVRLLSVVGYPVGTWGETSRFLYDFMRTVCDLYADNYFGYFTELCHRNGVRSMCETYGGPFDSIHCASLVDIPMGEIWDRHNGECMSETCRMAAGVAHLVGGSGVAAAEAFTGFPPSAHFETTPADLRIRTDDAWARGINRIVYHSYVHQPWHNVKPGATLGSHGTQLNRHTTWWQKGRVWSDYVRRGQYLLRTGVAQADVLTVADTDLIYNGLHADYPCLSHDLACVQTFWRLEKTDGGVWVPGRGNTVYPCVVLVGNWYASLRTLRKIRQLVSDGADVAALPPAITPSLSDKASEWKCAAAELFGGMKRGDLKRIGSGRLLMESDVQKAVAAFGVHPAVRNADGLKVVHRRFCDRDIYYLANVSTNQPVRRMVSLACVPGHRAEIWDAWDGTHGPAAVASESNGRADVFVDIPPTRSVFIVFTKGEPNPVVTVDVTAVGDSVRFRTHLGKPEVVFFRPCEIRVRKPKGETVLSAVDSDFPRPLDLSDGWAVTFCGLGAPEGEYAFPRLLSWSDRDEADIRYFAGRGIYCRKFTWHREKAQARIVLDLGDVRDVAKVALNGKPVATVIEAPYVADVTDFLKEGENVLKVEVINCWPNRLVGDAKERVAKSLYETEEPGYRCPEWALNDLPRTGNGPWTWTTKWLPASANDALLPAGLLGPVVLRGEVHIGL